MKRYSRTKRKFDKNGNVVLTTTYYPEIPLGDEDRLYRTTVGDRLDKLAFTFYEDITLWWILAKANGIRGKMALEPGTLIRIPGDVTSILQNFVQKNR